jgi:hypothetical protein
MIKLNHFSIYNKSYFLFERILAACLIIDMLVFRIFNFSSGYSRACGLMGNEFDYLRPKIFSLYLNANWQIWGLFFFSLACYIALFVNFKTRYFKILSFIAFSLTIYLFPLHSFGFHTYLQTLLFFNLFITVDSYKAKYTIRTPITSLLIVQIIIVYLFNYLNKFGETWLDGTALLHASLNSNLATGLGFFWLKHYDLSIIVSKMVYKLELIIPICLVFAFIFKPIRILIVILILCLHLPISLFINVGLFPIISIGVAILLLPEKIWQKKLFVKSANEILISKVETKKSAFVVICTLTIIVFSSSYYFINKSNADQLNQNEFLKLISKVPSNSFFLFQDWKLFAPNPPKELGYICLIESTNQNIISESNNKNQFRNRYNYNQKLMSFITLMVSDFNNGYKMTVHEERILNLWLDFEFNNCKTVIEPDTKIDLLLYSTNLETLKECHQWCYNKTLVSTFTNSPINKN